MDISGRTTPEILFLGPDEVGDPLHGALASRIMLTGVQNTADLMDWACLHAKARGASFWKVGGEFGAGRFKLLKLAFIEFHDWQERRAVGWCPARCGCPLVKRVSASSDASINRRSVWHDQPVGTPVHFGHLQGARPAGSRHEEGTR